MLTLFLARALGPGGYGVLSLAAGIGIVLNLPSDLGISGSAARYIAERRGNPRIVADVLVDALRLKLIAATVISLALFVAAGPIADAYGSPDLAWPLRAIAIALFGQSMMGLFTGAFAALGRVALSLRVVVAESTMETVASIALVLLGAGATGAAFGRATGYVFGATVAAAVMVRALGRRAIAERGHKHVRTREMMRYAGALFIISGAFTLFQAIDVLLIGAILGTSAVGLFSAPARLMNVFTYPGLAAASGVAPRLAREDGRDPEVAPLTSALRYMIILQSVVLAPVIVWAGPILGVLLGPGYGESAAVLRALAPMVFLVGVAPLVSLSVNYLGEARRRVPIAIGTVLTNFVIDLVLIPEIGIVAGAIGTDVAYGFYVAAHFWILRRIVKMAVGPILATALRCLVAAAAMTAVLAAFGTSHLSVPAFVAGGLIGAVVYAALLMATRAVSLDEVRSAGRALGRRLALRRHPPTR